MLCLLCHETSITGISFAQAYCEQQARDSLTSRLNGKMLNDSLFSFRFMGGCYRRLIRRPLTMSLPRSVCLTDCTLEEPSTQRVSWYDWSLIVKCNCFALFLLLACASCCAALAVSGWRLTAKACIHTWGLYNFATDISPNFGIKNIIRIKERVWNAGVGIHFFWRKD